MDKISSQDLFQAWYNAVQNQKADLLDNWQNPKVYTSCIIHNDASVLIKIAEQLGLLCYNQDYYCIDAVLYEKNDLVPGIGKDQYWLRNIRVAFEHENYFNSGIFQEVSHLLITNCDLRVLVTYPNGDGKTELEYLHSVIQGSRQSKQISEEESFLIIFGYQNDFTWEGYVYKEDKWKSLEPIKDRTLTTIQ